MSEQVEAKVWAFVVEVRDPEGVGLTESQAEQVMMERMGYDEDYGFPYTLHWDLDKALTEEASDVVMRYDPTLDMYVY